MSTPIIQFDHTTHDCIGHDLAQPVCMVIPGHTKLGQPVFMGKVMGGLTKLEAGALRIAAALAPSVAPEKVGLVADTNSVASIAADLAAAVLVECEMRQEENERTVIAERQAATRRNGHAGGDDVGKGRIFTP